MRAAARGDAAATAALMETHIDPVHRHLMRLTDGDYHLACDVAQNTWIKVGRALATYDPERGPFLPWVFRIATNALNDAYRSAKRDRRREERLAAHLVTGGYDTEVVPSAEEEAQTREGARTSLDLLRRLTRKQAVVVALMDHDGLSLHEAATELGISYEAAKGRRRHALLALRAEYRLANRADRRGVTDPVVHTVKPRGAHRATEASRG